MWGRYPQASFPQMCLRCCVISGETCDFSGLWDLPDSPGVGVGGCLAVGSGSGPGRESEWNNAPRLKVGGCEDKGLDDWGLLGHAAFSLTGPLAGQCCPEA